MTDAAAPARQPVDPVPPPRLRWPLAAVLIVVSSAAVLVSEIVATRVIAPYVGVTLETLSAVIGCVLAGIALGSWLGGMLADRVATWVVLVMALVIGGGLLIASPGIVAGMGPGSSTEPSSALALAAAAFFLPSVALSAVGPCVVKALGEGSGRLGSVAGALSALGTAGALAGNFSAGFWLVGSYRGRQILIGCGVVCLVLAAITALALVPRRKTRAIAALPVVLALLLVAQADEDIPCDRETEYVCLTIEGTAADGYLIKSNIYSSSFTHPAQPSFLRFGYAKTVVAVTAAQLGAARSPSFGYVGGGGYTLPLYYEDAYPEARHVVYEIDGQMVRAVAEALGLPDLEERFPTVVGDARVELAAAGRGEHDVIIGDAFAGISVPWHLTTAEFLEEVERVLSPEGVYVMNLIDYDDHRLARAEVATMTAVFDEVAMLVDPAVLEGSDAGTNIILVGGRDLPDVPTLQAELIRTGSQTRPVTGDELASFVAGEDVLTDAYAPVDQLVGRP